MTDPTTVPATPRTKAGQEFQKWFGIGEAWTNIIPMILAIEDEAATPSQADRGEGLRAAAKTVIDHYDGRNTFQPLLTRADIDALRAALAAKDAER